MDSIKCPICGSDLFYYAGTCEARKENEYGTLIYDLVRYHCYGPNLNNAEVHEFFIPNNKRFEDK